MSEARKNTYQINMADAFGEVFGRGNIPRRYVVPNNESSSPIINVTLPIDNAQAVVPVYSGMDTITRDEIKGTSWLGTPIQFKFGFSGGNYNVYRNGKIVQERIGDFQFPLSTMVEFSRAKRITTTPTLGGGTVKEMYGLDDWSIRIRGFCIPDPKHPQAESAKEQRNWIAKYEQLADSIRIVDYNDVFTDLGIYHLVIRDVNFPSVPGRPNWLPFELMCISDEPLELLK